MDNKDMNKQLDAIKRQVTDVARDMHARKLAIPAAALMIAIVAALIVLPKGGGTAPPAPAPDAQLPSTHVERVAKITLVKPSSLDKMIPINSSSNPFEGTTGYTCKEISANPHVVECLVSNVLIRIYCEGQETIPACAKTGATGAAGGASSSTGGSGTGNGGGGSTGGGGSGGGTTRWYVWEASVKVDLKTINNVRTYDAVPTNAPLAVFFGGDSGEAVFIAADGVTVSGVPVDPSFSAFKLKKGQTATLTDSAGKKHTLKLNSIKLVATSQKP